MAKKIQVGEVRVSHTAGGVNIWYDPAFHDILGNRHFTLETVRAKKQWALHLLPAKKGGRASRSNNKLFDKNYRLRFDRTKVVSGIFPRFGLTTMTFTVVSAETSSRIVITAPKDQLLTPAEAREKLLATATAANLLNQQALDDLEWVGQLIDAAEKRAGGRSPDVVKALRSVIQKWVDDPAYREAAIHRLRELGYV